MKVYVHEGYEFLEFVLQVDDYPRLGTTALRESALMEAQIDAGFCLIQDLVGTVQDLGVKLIRERRGKVKESDRFDVRATMLWIEQQQFLMEAFLTRYVDNYLAYVSGLLFEIYTQRPETLKTQEKIEIEFVLSHGTMSELVQGIAERRVAAVSYRSFEDLVDYFAEAFKLELVEPALLPVVVEAIETRNLSVHNRCVINDRYLKRTKQSLTLLGTRRDVRLKQVLEISRVLSASCRRVDALARKKLRLRGRRFVVEQPERMGRESPRQY